MSPLFANAMDEDKDGTTEDDILASSEDRIASSQDGLRNQSLQGKALEMVRRHQATWSGHPGELWANEHRIDLEQETVPSRQARHQAGHSSRGLIKAEI